VGTAVANLITHRSHPQTAAPAPQVDLAPLEGSVAELQTQQRNLREQVMEQNTSLKRVEDRLESVREATDRNTLEQQELLEDLKTFSNKIKVVAVIGIGLLVAGVLLNLIVFMHLQRVLP
jgi:ABC-type multidrug transport system fused ATPase/permease subunit